MCFDNACEIASRYFGMNNESSCIERAWDKGKEWVFEPVGASRSLGRTAVSVDKSVGFLIQFAVPMGVDVTHLVQWKYRAHDED